MILRRYGSTLESVDVQFDARAMNEIGFRRNRETSIPRDEFDETHQLVSSHELSCTHQGDVQDQVEQALLEDLGGQLEELERDLGEGEVLVVECEPGKDWPKTRGDQKRSPEGELHFRFRVDPPLRMGVYRRSG